MKQPFPETKVRITEQWNIPHYQDPFYVDAAYYQPSGARTKEVKVTDLITNEVKLFACCWEASEAFGWGKSTAAGALLRKQNAFGRYKVEYTGRKV